MKYECGVCGQVVEGDSLKFIDHNEQHIVDLVKTKHPDWQEKDGVCGKCVDYYRDQIKGRSAQ